VVVGRFRAAWKTKVVEPQCQAEAQNGFSGTLTCGNIQKIGFDLGL
jgi:hypothetical protein